MTSKSPRYAHCQQCKARFQQADGPGRKKAYCTTVCRRKAQRERLRRDGGDNRSPLPMGLRIAEELHALTAELLEAEYRDARLPGFLRHVGSISRELEYYTAAAVYDERVRGASWEAVAAAARVSPSTARSRWGDKQVKRRLTRRAKERAAAAGERPSLRTVIPQPASAPGLEGDEAVDDTPARAAARASGKLALALSHLHRTSGLTIRDVAERTGLSASYVSRILSGERVPTWPAAVALCEVFDGVSEQLRVLWECAHGVVPAARLGFKDCAARLQAALLGLHLAAAWPATVRIQALSRGMLRQETIESVLDGSLIPDWDTTGLLVTALGGLPGDIRPLWEDLHYAFLVCSDPAAPAEGSAPDEVGPVIGQEDASR